MAGAGAIFSERRLRWAVGVIFVATGNYMGFPRLVNAVEQLKTRGTMGDEVFMQIGSTAGFASSACETVRFLPREEFERRMREASVIISHAGAGTLIDALKAGKVPVVMPRRKKYGEHVDDHQVEVAEALAREGRIIMACEAEDLPEAIEKARRCDAQIACREPWRMIELVARAIDELTIVRS
jgi:exopolysaccharide biosynthesis glucuronosyltransferase PssE